MVYFCILLFSVTVLMENFATDGIKCLLVIDVMMCDMIYTYIWLVIFVV